MNIINSTTVAALYLCELGTVNLHEISSSLCMLGMINLHKISSVMCMLGTVKLDETSVLCM